MSQNWWVKDNGVVTLKGVDDDDDNPPILTAEEIAYFLRTSGDARLAYNEIYPTLLPAEQDRLDAIIEDNPRMTELVNDRQSFLDNVQSKANRAGVRLTWM